MIEIGSVLVDRYSILDNIGSGGMSIVYKARDTKLERFVAIKVLREEFCLDENFVKKFKVEAQSAASLSHNNIVNIYDVGNEGRIHFIVMEYLEGETLKDYINNNGHLADEEIYKISVCIASALEHAHNNHIIHRDIKPQNIMLTQDGQVKVMDFGIARIASGNTIDVPDSPSGSVYYIAPEQARGGFQDNKSDLYSLGITMYEMGTGSVPFTGDTAVNVALKQIHDELPDPSERNENLSQNIKTIITKATQKKTTQRYQTAREIVYDLKQSMNNPDDILIYTIDNAPEETLIMSHEEMKHIWSKNEVIAYNKKRDPLDTVVAVLGITLALLVVGLITLFAYNNIAKERIPVDVMVPNVIGMEQLEADRILAELSLGMNVVESVYDEEYEAGEIISQDPLVNSVVLIEETIIQVVVSKGIETTKVFGVMSQDYKLATKALEDRGFVVTMITENHETVPAGTVYQQEPLPNTEVPLNTGVTIYVSAGPEEVFYEVPDLVNLSETQAEAALERVNMNIGAVTYLFNDDVPEGSVISMTVEAGRMVKEGYTVDIAVSKGKEIINVTREYVINNVADQDQTSYTLKVVLSLNGVDSILFEGQVDATNFPMIVSATGYGEGKITVYNNDNFVYPFNVYLIDVGASE